MSVSKPFISPDPSLVKLETVNLVSMGESNEPVPHPYSDFSSPVDLTDWWNPSLSIQVSATITLNLKEISSLLKMNPDEQLVLGSRVYCSHTKLMTVSPMANVIAQTSVISTTIDKYSIGQQLDLRFSLGLKASKSRKTLGAVYQLPKFAQLWSTVTQFRLTGAHSMMNVRWVTPEEDSTFGNALWKFSFFTIDSVSPEEWLHLDTSAVLEVRLNSLHREQIENNRTIYAAMWAELGYSAINKVMVLPDGQRKEILKLVSKPNLGGSWISWLREQFSQAFSYQTLDFVEHEWFNNPDEVLPRLQSAKLSRLSASKVK